MNKKILLTGASGYIGRELLQDKRFRAYHIRCLVRDPRRMIIKTTEKLEVVAGDVFDPSTLSAAMNGIDIAFYFIHSMDISGKFESRDRVAAQNFAAAAKNAGVKKIIYLGGLGDSSTDLSPHLRSRHEVGEILRQSGVTTIEFRASIVLGSGSLSFELFSSLVERLPAMITPRWIKVHSQPISIEDLLTYLLQAVELELNESQIFEIGGADQITYRELMNLYARHRNLRRVMIPVPFLTPRLSGLWLGLVTPVNAQVGQNLVNSIFHPTVVRDHSAEKYFHIQPITSELAIAQALKKKENHFERFAESGRLEEVTTGLIKTHFMNFQIENRVLKIPATSSIVFRAISRLGGKNGWYGYNWLWRLRGILEFFVGGSSYKPSRPAGNNLETGDMVDFWQVEAVEKDSYIRFAGKFKLPGKAWLEFELQETDEHCTLRQTALFYPHGLLGLIYWALLYPMHMMVLKQLIDGIAEYSVSKSEDTADSIHPA